MHCKLSPMVCGFDLGLQAWQAGILGTVPLRQMVFEEKKCTNFKDCLHREDEDECHGGTKNVCNLRCFVVVHKRDITFWRPWTNMFFQLKGYNPPTPDRTGHSSKTIPESSN